MYSRPNFETGYLDTTYHFLERLKLCHVTGYGPIVMKLLSEHFFLKLCQKDNHLQSRETLKLLLIKINFTFSGSQQLLIFRRS